MESWNHSLAPLSLALAHIMCHLALLAFQAIQAGPVPFKGSGRSTQSCCCSLFSQSQPADPEPNRSPRLLLVAPSCPLVR